MNGITETMPPALPRRGAALDHLKVIAAGAMVADHVNTILLGGRVPELWLIGRLAFPLFCFILATHWVRGVDPARYARRLFLWAIPAQVAYTFAFEAEMGNVLVTLGLGVLMAAWIERQSTPIRALTYAAAFASSFLPLGTDYGLVGIVFPALLVGILRLDALSAAAFLPLLIALNPNDWAFANPNWFSATAQGAAAILCGGFLLRNLRLPPDAAPYLPRYSLYLFYPAHLALLAGMRAVLG